MENFENRKYIVKINKTDKHELHVTSNNVISYQKGVYYAGTKLCNALPVNIKMLNFDMKTFMPAFCLLCRTSV